MSDNRIGVDKTPSIKDLPMTSRSERQIKRDAPKAIDTLRELGAIDLVETLGLMPHFKA